MSPLDDELRNLLTSRAEQVAPAPDPLAGIESRARRMHRNRLAGAALASVIVLAGIGLAVPSLLPDRDSGSTQFATQQPSSTRGEPISTWQPRGNATPEALTFAKTSYGTGAPGDAVFVRLLWGGSPDNGPQVLICLAGAVGADGSEQPRDIALFFYAEDGVKKYVGSQSLTEDAREITRVVDVGSGPYVVALGEPGTTQIAYAKDGGDDFLDQQQTDGVVSFVRTGPTGNDPDLVLYTFDDGDQKTVQAGGPGAGASGAYRLDPAKPWAYRGDQTALGSGMLTTTQSEWSTRHPGSTLTPLFGQVYEPSGQHEIAFVASGDGRTRWGYATSSESGPSFFVDETLETKPAVLMAALPGDEVPRLFVLAAPNTGELGYAQDYQRFRALVGPAPGVAYAPLEGDTTNAAVRVLDADRNLDKPVFLGPAPSAGSVSTPTAPTNALDWAPRGETPDPATLDRATNAFAQADGKTGDAFTRVLFAGKTSDGRPYVYFQAWKGSQKARLAGYESDGKGGGTPFYGPEIGPDPAILGYVVTNGASKELLVLVPRPGVGQVSYSPDDTTPFRAVANGRSDTNPVGLVDRDPRATSDRYEVNAADASLLQRGPVLTLLCGASGCG